MDHVPAPRPTEAELQGWIDAARAGERWAADRLAAHDGPFARGAVARRTGARLRRRGDPDAVANRVLAEVLAKLPVLRGPVDDARLRRHLVRTAGWRVRDHARSVLPVPVPAPLEEDLALPPRSSMGPVTTADLSRKLRHLVGELPSPSREVVHLKLWEDWTWERIGRAHDHTGAWARRRFDLAMKGLQRRMSSTGR